MFLIIALMLIGILLGMKFFYRSELDRWLKFIGKTQQIATITLLFVMGLWLGSNSEFWAGLKTMGLHGFLFALLTIAGSVICVFLFSKILVKGNNR